MVGFARIVGAAVVAVVIVAAPALAEKRVALVIGNAVYEHAPALANTRNDAADIGAALERLGFEVTRREDQDFDGFRRTLQSFSRAASAADVAVVFYAGHGFEVDKQNYLVPVDATLASDRDVDFEAVPLDLVLRSVEGARRLRLVILDACRDNPFVAAMSRAGGTRALGRGLARVEPAGDTLVAYAAREGTTADDGTGRNSPYTAALLAHLEEPGLEIQMLFRRVRDAVMAATGERQEPFVYGSLSSEAFYLVAPSRPPVAEPAPGFDERAFDLAFWESIRDSVTPVDFEEYLSQYPDGAFVGLARRRLDELRRAEVAAVVAPPAPRIEVETLDSLLVALRNANVRAGPSADTDQLDRLAAGTEVTVTGKVKDRDWYRIALAAGEGYVWAPLLGEIIETETAARQAILVDFVSGAVLLEKNSDHPFPPGSMSKLMTVYMLFEQLEKGTLSLDDTMRVSEKAWRMGGSKMFVEVGSDVRVEDLLRGIIVSSGNDACTVVAEALAGSEEAFAALMTKRAREIGLTDSVFANSTGRPDPGHSMTARDLAILTKRIVVDFPEHFPYFAEKTFTYNDIQQDNRNPLLYEDLGADGMKTAHTEETGYGLTATAERSGQRLILVITGLDSSRARAEEAERLLVWGFQTRARHLARTR